jgi:translation initiation factor 2B subunit (eIF-2B alpha/beta/delta family)
MSDVEKQLKRIQDKLQQVLKDHSALQKENLRLKEELDKNRTQSFSHQQNIEDLKQQVEVLKITSGDWEEGDKKEFEKRINSYIKEIDRCIALLSE